MREWLRHGAWNILEHGLSRGMDALATIALIWFIPTGVFSQLAISQAYVAPALFLFICPETTFYREFGEWKREGPEALLARVRAFRRFAWLKAVAAIGLAAVLAASFPSPSGSTFGFTDRFFALVWAFSLPLMPQISGGDREFLRLNLDLRTLNFITLFQRALYLSLLVLVATLFSITFPAIAGVAIVTATATAWIARRAVEKRFVGVLPTRIPEENVFELLKSSLRGFSIWNHIAGVIVGWIQTLDLFLLGFFRLPALEIGLYSVALKLANFTLAIPYAVSNLYNVFLGRTARPKDLAEKKIEKRILLKLTLGLMGFSAAQALVFYKIGPWILVLLSRGRWSSEEQTRILSWLYWILPAAACFSSLLFWTGWMSIRTSFRRLVFTVYLPWGVIGAGIYFYSVKAGGVDLVARANLSVIFVLVILLSISTLMSEIPGRSRRTQL